MKRKLSVLMMATVLMIFTAACNAGDKDESTPTPTPATDNIPEWSLAIARGDGETAFTSVDAALLSVHTIEVTTTGKDGVETTSTYTGARLSDILGKIGVTDFTSLTVASSDGFEIEFDRALALADDTLLAWERDGKELDTDPPLRMAPAQGTANQFVKSTAKIIINK